jgi:hypothetical protein
MVVGNRDGHGNLSIVLLARLSAILPRNPDRMPPLLRKARIIDDPTFDPPVPLDLRQHHPADLGEDLLVRPSAFTNKMQQRLMLRPLSGQAP